MDKLLLVDKNDKVVGYETKEKCHEGKGILHRAFSVYLFDDKGRLLIQQRSKDKKLWPFYWANSCCSHPREDEDYVIAGERRLVEELGFTAPLRMIGKLTYYAPYKNIGSEREMLAILVGHYNGEKIKPNPKEVANWKWVRIDDVLQDFKKNPDKYAPWFKLGLKRYLKVKKEEEKRKEKIKDILQKNAKKVEPVIKKLLEHYVDNKFKEIVNYQISTGGKRLRPTLAILSAKVFGGKESQVIYPAAGLEILHNSSLIVDDIIDNSILRRNQPTVWAKFGKSVAECIGLGYLASAFASISKVKNPIEVSEVLVRALKTVIINGEIYDILFEQKGRENEPYIVKNRYHNIKVSDYYKMAGQKTASLFEACCEIGAICANASKSQIEKIKKYGFNLGIAFQIQDDVLDIFGDQKKFGKKIGKDIEERKLGNIVILLALEELKGKDKQKILTILRKEKITDNDIKEAIEIIKKTNSLRRARQLMEEAIKKANESLNVLPQNKWKGYLSDFLDYLAQRDY